MKSFQCSVLLYAVHVFIRGARHFEILFYVYMVPEVVCKQTLFCSFQCVPNDLLNINPNSKNSKSSNFRIFTCDRNDFKILTHCYTAFHLNTFATSKILCFVKFSTKEFTIFNQKFYSRLFGKFIDFSQKKGEA